MEDKTYRIGNYEFETLREYRQAQQDLDKIKYITDELDIYDPEVALRLYTMMREKKIRFKSEIGKSFFWCISDIVADNTQNMIQEKIAKEEAEAASRMPFHFSWQQIAGFVCILIAVACLGYYVVSEYSEYRAAKKLEELRENASHNMEEQLGTESVYDGEPITEQAAEAPDGETEEEKPLVILEEYAELHAQNSEMAGWISIPGTDIDYPVMQTSTDDPDYYLRHDFNKEEDSNGIPFIDARNDYIDRDTNIIVYGHNMRSGMIFGGLKKYLEEDYLKEHPYIEFNTIYEEATYEIIAVGLSEVQYQDAYVFRYYNFLNADDEEGFNEYISNIAKLSVYGPDIDASYGDELLTLSTCNSYTEDGRMFVLAKKIQ